MISSDVEQVVQTALAKDPGQRFVSVQAFARALEQAHLPTPPPVIAPLSTLPDDQTVPVVPDNFSMNFSASGCRDRSQERPHTEFFA